MERIKWEILEPEMVSWRRHLHRNPELSYQERATAAFVRDKLTSFGLEVRGCGEGYGVLGVLRGSRPGATVALRADMDALPIQDEKACEYASEVPGVMHACGHDGHTAILLAVARYFSGIREELAGELRFLFQPAEEVCPGGALGLIADGALAGADAVYGLHLWTPLPVGTVASAPGPLMASTDEFFIDIVGKGGHAGAPHRATDSIVAASALVLQLQTVVSRNVDPLRPAVVSIGTIQGGYAQNIVAEQCRITGTVRTFDEESRELIRERIKAMTASVAAAYGTEARIDFMIGYPTLVNDEEETRRFFRCAPAALGEEMNVAVMEKIMPAEDFAYYVRELPGCFMFVGAGNPEKDAVYPHHHPRFDFDENAMLHGAKLLAAMAESRLAGA